MIEKLRGAYLRMSRRERMMTLGVAGVLFLLINLFVCRLVLGGISSSRRELALRKGTRTEQTVYMRERDLWAKRQQWLEKTQLPMKGDEEATTMLDDLKQIAGKHNNLIVNLEIGS